MIDSISNVFQPITRPDIIVFITQTSLLFIVVITSLVNLSIRRDENTNLWTMVLTSCLGYMMPNPRFKVQERGKDSNINELTVPIPTTTTNDGLLRDFTVKRDQSA